VAWPAARKCRASASAVPTRSPMPLRESDSEPGGLRPGLAPVPLPVSRCDGRAGRGSAGAAPSPVVRSRGRRMPRRLQWTAEGDHGPVHPKLPLAVTPADAAPAARWTAAKLEAVTFIPKFGSMARLAGADGTSMYGLPLTIKVRSLVPTEWELRDSDAQPQPESKKCIQVLWPLRPPGSRRFDPHAAT
jgi:hypothetical protein